MEPPKRKLTVPKLNISRAKLSDSANAASDRALTNRTSIVQK